MACRGYEIVVFDMDGVLVDIESSWCWVHDHFGVSNEHSLRAYLNGEIDDLEFIRRDTELWRSKCPDISRNDVVKILEGVPLMHGYKDCISTLKRKGFKTAIISGGLKPLAERIGGEHFDYIMANDLREKKGRLTGEGLLEVKLNDKGESFENLFKSEKEKPERVIAVGDSHIDIPMLERAGLGIAFDPKGREIREAAEIVIEEKDLSKILDFV